MMLKNRRQWISRELMMICEGVRWSVLEEDSIPCVGDETPDWSAFFGR